jgi:DNA invertase Pin-like site-specific DNA recombinase
LKMVAQMQNTTKRDALYARYSSHAQDDGTSIEVQIEQCERSAGSTCIHYIDRAKTGRAMGGRSALISLLADADAGKIGRVFVYKFDRLGRAADTHLIAQQLDDARVPLISATEGTNALARGIQLVVAEDYSRQLAMRTRDGLKKRFEQAAFTGGVAPYGYCVVSEGNRRILAIEPSEAGIVREIVHMYLCEAIGFKGIAKRLRAKQIASRRGAGWSFTSVRSLLVNETLTGKVRYNVRRMQLNRGTGKRSPRTKDAAEHMERQDETLRIIDDATFQKIQERIGTSGRKGAVKVNRAGIAPFSGLVYCQCGAKCYRMKSSNAKGTYHYYVCSRHLRYEDCETSGRVREDKLIEVVNGRIGRVFDREDEIIARALELAAEATRDNREDAKRIKDEIASVEAEQARLIELLMDRAISGPAKETINRKMTEAEQHRTALLAALDGLREDANDNTDALAGIVREVPADGQDRCDPALEQDAPAMVRQAQGNGHAPERSDHQAGIKAGGFRQPDRAAGGDQRDGH